MYAPERQQLITELARAHGRVSVSELSQRFEVTAETIRRDLDSLAERGLISRVHGGAVPAERIRLVETGVGTREAEQATEKQRIAEAAITLLPQRNDVTVILDAGTTVGRLADLMPAGRVSTIVTNCLHTAATASNRNRAEVHIVGGRIRGITQAAVGSATVDSMRMLRADLAFLGANGFTVGHGFSTPDPAEGEVKRAMVAAARRVAVLADSSKFGAEYLVTFAATHQVDYLVTDRSLPPAARQAFTDRGIEVVLA